MFGEPCIGSICFVPLNAGGDKLFGFSEFIAALALIVLAWTTTDVRYRFRAHTAPIPLRGLTFVVVMVVGTMTLFTDLWRAQQWPVPVGNVITPAAWQALLGGAFFSTFALWAWFAFIRPPIYSRWNSFRFAGAVYSTILKGSPTDIPVIAEELWRSAASLVEHSWTVSEMRDELRNPENEGRIERGGRRVKTHAYQLLLMIGDKRFCRYAVSVPSLAEKLFRAISETSKHNVPIETFAKNITEQAIANKDSFVYHEVEAYESGYIGFHKPITRALYGNFLLLEDVKFTFDVDYRAQMEWDGEQWSAFQRLIILCMDSYVRGGWMHRHSFVLHRSIGRIGDSVMGAHILDGAPAGEYFKAEEYKKIRAAVEFVDCATEIMNNLDSGTLRSALRRSHHNRDLFLLIAEVMAKVVFAGSSIRSPSMTSWSIQYGTVWGHFFGLCEPNEAEKVVRRIFFRILLKDITDMDLGPNYKGCRILGMMLNVMGLNLANRGGASGYAPFHRAIVGWTVRNFDRLYLENPELVESCLPDALAYEFESHQLVKTFEKGLSRDPARRYLRVDPAPGRLG